MLNGLSARPAQALIPVTRALELVLDTVRPLGYETVDINGAIGRVLAQDVLASGNVPPFPCSAMDGYAIIAGQAGRRLTVVGESRAGTPSGRRVGEGEAVRISTGAAVPEGATAVIAQEQVSADERFGGRGEAEIELRAAASPGQHIRGSGEDMRAGAPILSAGTRLSALDVGAAVAAGAGALTVACRPRVTVLCTGDELRSPGEPLGPGEIHNSNAPMLTGLAGGAGALTAPAQRLRDDPEATEAGIAAALEDSSVVIISGGVSVGPHDHVKPALESLGVREIFWSVALQPGKPTWFGTRDGHGLAFGLPGNPVSAVVTFSLFVAPALAALQGAGPPPAPWPSAILGTDVPRNPVREQAIRVRLEADAQGPVAVPTGAQASHILTSLLAADALAMIPAGEGELAAGTRVGLRAIAR